MLRNYNRQPAVAQPTPYSVVIPLRRRPASFFLRPPVLCFATFSAAAPAYRVLSSSVFRRFGKRKGKGMENEVVESELVLPTHLNFKKIQMYEKYPKGQSRGRHWKHLKQIIQAENYQSYHPDQPNYVNIETPLSMHPPKRICDITGYKAPYIDPRTKMRYANAEVFKLVRSLPNEYVQRYLALRNAAVVLK